MLFTYSEENPQTKRKGDADMARITLCNSLSVCLEETYTL
jgi:hypothetical protein